MYFCQLGGYPSAPPMPITGTAPAYPAGFQAPFGPGIPQPYPTGVQSYPGQAPPGGYPNAAPMPHPLPQYGQQAPHVSGFPNQPYGANYPKQQYGPGYPNVGSHSKKHGKVKVYGESDSALIQCFLIY